MAGEGSEGVAAVEEKARKPESRKAGERGSECVRSERMRGEKERARKPESSFWKKLEQKGSEGGKARRQGN
jgi:hypothetical protein